MKTASMLVQNKKKIVVKKGAVRTTSSRKVHRTGETTEENSEKSLQSTIAYEGQEIAVVRVSSGVTMCDAYQSVRIDVGVDFPVAIPMGVSDGEKKAALHEAAIVSYSFVEAEMESVSKSAEIALSELVRAFGGRR